MCLTLSCCVKCWGSRVKCRVSAVAAAVTKCRKRHSLLSREHVSSNNTAYTHMSRHGTAHWNAPGCEMHNAAPVKWASHMLQQRALCTCSSEG